MVTSKLPGFGTGDARQLAGAALLNSPDLYKVPRYLRARWADRFRK
jgi:hypothetical protein